MFMYHTIKLCLIKYFHSHAKYIHNWSVFWNYISSIYWLLSLVVIFVMNHGVNPLLFWEVARRRLVVGYRRFETTHQSRLQGWCSPITAWPEKMGSFDCLALEYRTDRLSRNIITNYQPTLRNIADKQMTQIHCDGSLKSRIILWFIFPLIFRETMNWNSPNL
jgi:hypothetical protein